MIEIVHGSVVDQRVDAIVNAANHGLLGGGGVDGAIHRAAGPAFEAECRALHDAGGCATGDAKIVNAHEITWAKHIVLTVGPVYSSGQADRCAQQLASCYQRSCEVALEADDASIAFPAISCGVYGYPLEDAVLVSLEALRPYVNRFERIVLAMFKGQEFDRAVEVAREVVPTHMLSDSLVVDL
jgi:O-acetyl-ADP-ribose deacetylase (regulator of RNase III)